MMIQQRPYGLGLGDDNTDYIDITGSTVGGNPDYGTFNPATDAVPGSGGGSGTLPATPTASQAAQQQQNMSSSSGSGGGGTRSNSSGGSYPTSAFPASGANAWSNILQGLAFNSGTIARAITGSPVLTAQTCAGAGGVWNGSACVAPSSAVSSSTTMLLIAGVAVFAIVSLNKR
jgi:hypothetical protein